MRNQNLSEGRNAGRTITRNVSVTPELDNFVATHLSTGLYSNYSEVVRAALRIMMDLAEERQLKLNRLLHDSQPSLEQAKKGNVRKVRPERLVNED